MNILDYVIVVAYLAGMLAFGFALRKQSSEEDYFLGGKSLGWMPLTLSTMATQLSAISFISAPGFVGLREGGGLSWLTYEFAVPLAMLLVTFVILPALYRAGVVSIYDYLERRFSRSTRLFISVAFQIARSFSTGIMVYATGIILEAVLGIPFWQSILLISIITIIYSLQGGMKAVVYGDAIQMILIIFGLALCVFFALDEMGGLDVFLGEVDPERLVAVDFFSFGFSGDEFGFIPMLFGGFVLYASYYGCDQTQAQRALSAKNMTDIKKLLIANGFLRFPITLLYCFAGLVVGVLAFRSPEFLAQIPADRPDFMMPIFIIEYLPNGVIGLLLVAILAAAMSTLSSTINSLSAVTMEDLNMVGLRGKSRSQEVFISRLVAFFWGVVTLVLSAFAGNIAPTVIEAINKVGSALYGPILGVFLIAIISRNVGARAVNVGLLGGLSVNLMLWLNAPHIFWMWWNFIGLVVTASLAFVIQLFTSHLVPSLSPSSSQEQVQGDADTLSDILAWSSSGWKGTVLALSLYFILIVAVSMSFS